VGKQGLSDAKSQQAKTKLLLWETLQKKNLLPEMSFELKI
jgi:hypothetical protein